MNHVFMSYHIYFVDILKLIESGTFGKSFFYLFMTSPAPPQIGSVLSVTTIIYYRNASKML